MEANSLSDEFGELLDSRLTAKILERLADICRRRFDENPVLYWSLQHIFEDLAAEYDGQAVTEERHNAHKSALGPLLRSLSVSDLNSPTEYLPRLTAILRADHDLGPYAGP